MNEESCLTYQRSFRGSALDLFTFSAPKPQAGSQTAIAIDLYLDVIFN